VQAGTLAGATRAVKPDRALQQLHRVVEVPAVELEHAEALEHAAFGVGVAELPGFRQELLEHRVGALVPKPRGDLGRVDLGLADAAVDAPSEQLLRRHAELAGELDQHRR
jgi:hypothetical protein